MKFRRRFRAKLLIGVALLAGAWLVPPFFHAGRYRRLLEAGLERKLGRPVKLGQVSFSLLPHFGFSAENVVIGESPRFGTEPLARMARLECDLRWKSLLGSGLNCARIVLDHPSINMVRNGQGLWNLEELLMKHTTMSRQQVSGRPAASGGLDIEIDDAEVSFTLGITKKPFVIAGVTGGMTLDPATRSLHFQFTGTPERIDLAVPTAPGPVELSGLWAVGSDFDGPFSITIHTSNSAVYGWIPLLTGRNPDIYGVAGATVQLAGTLNRFHIQAQASFHQLHRWESLPPLSSMPVGVSFRGFYDRARDQLFVQSANASFGKSLLHFAGSINGLPWTPKLDLVLAIERSRLQDFAALAMRLEGGHSGLSLSGRTDGLLTIQGPWRKRNYDGYVAIHSLQLQTRRISFEVPKASVHVSGRGVRLLPARVLVGSHVECVAEGVLSPAFPEGAEGSQHGIEKPSRTWPGEPSGHYRLTLSVTHAPLHAFILLARSMGVRSALDLDARGWVQGAAQLYGPAWPFVRPQWTAEAELKGATLLVPGLTEPVHLRQFHLAMHNRKVRINPLVAQIGQVTFSGWLNHEGARARPWRFDARTPRLNMEQASLWFTVLGYQKPMWLLDLIPGLRTLVERRMAQRTVFASVNARGTFECPQIAFRSTSLQNVRAKLDIANRLAKVEGLSFEVAGGQGKAWARIDFKQTPARITGHFGLAGGRLASFTSYLPPALAHLRGVISAAGHFTTEGLTRPEMTRNLQGMVELDLRNVFFGAFNPLRALARAGSLPVVVPGRQGRRLNFAALDLTISQQRVGLVTSPLDLAGAILQLKGNWAFDGMTNLSVRADFSHVPPSWLAASPTRNPGITTSPTFSLAEGTVPATSDDRSPRGNPASGLDGSRLATKLPSEPSGQPNKPTKNLFTLDLAGPMRRLALVHSFDAARQAR